MRVFNSGECWFDYGDLGCFVYTFRSGLGPVNQQVSRILHPSLRATAHSKNLKQPVIVYDIINLLFPFIPQLV